MNAVEIEEAISALAERLFDKAEFPFAFLQDYAQWVQLVAAMLRRGFGTEEQAKLQAATTCAFFRQRSADART